MTLRPGAWKIDMWPLLRYVPGYLDELKDGYKEESALFKGQLDEMNRKMVGSLSSRFVV
jgi:hypothetical protein